MAEPERAWSQKDVSHLVELIGTSERVEAEYLQSVGGASLKGRSQEDIREMVAAVLGGKEPKDLVVDEVDLPTPPEAGGGDADRVENEGREHRSSSETRENASLGGEDAAGAARGSDDGFFVLPAKRAREEREIGEENFRRPFGPPASARPFRLPPEVVEISSGSEDEDAAEGALPQQQQDGRRQRGGDEEEKPTSPAGAPSVVSLSSTENSDAVELLSTSSIGRSHSSGSASGSQSSYSYTYSYTHSNDEDGSGGGGGSTSGEYESRMTSASEEGAGETDDRPRAEQMGPGGDGEAGTSRFRSAQEIHKETAEFKRAEEGAGETDDRPRAEQMGPGGMGKEAGTSRFRSAQEIHKETAEFKRADEEEWERRNRVIREQSLRAKLDRQRKRESNKRVEKRLEELKSQRDASRQQMEEVDRLRPKIRNHLSRQLMGSKHFPVVVQRLGLSKTVGPMSSAAELTKIYRKAILKYHPDRTASSSSLKQKVYNEEVFKILQTTYKLWEK